jgi:hypothetical protein
MRSGTARLNAIYAVCESLLKKGGNLSPLVPLPSFNVGPPLHFEEKGLTLHIFGDFRIVRAKHGVTKVCKAAQFIEASVSLQAISAITDDADVSGNVTALWVDAV